MNWMKFFWLTFFIFCFSACQGAVDQQPLVEKEQQLVIFSVAFEPDGDIPVEYTCDGNDRSPPMRWAGVPSQTKTLVLMVDDPDAPVGTWVHWVLFNIPVERVDLPPGISNDGVVAGVGMQGMNDFRRMGYGGPCPPPGDPHRYFFKVYALDTSLDLPPGATKSEVEAAMAGHILQEGQLVGLYGR